MLFILNPRSKDSSIEPSAHKKYWAIAALRGDTPPTAGIPNNSTLHTLHPPWGYAAFGGVGYWAIRVLCYSGSAWGYAAYGGHP